VFFPFPVRLLLLLRFFPGGMTLTMLALLLLVLALALLLSAVFRLNYNIWDSSSLTNDHDYQETVGSLRLG
jgi:protein-S-isoprenylcysteine O-methyltransferase Ste14